MKCCLAHALIALAATALCACAGSYDHGDTTREQGRTEVVFVPTLHRAHPHQGGYSFVYLSRLLEVIAPETVLAEIPPPAFARVVAASDSLAMDEPAGDEYARAEASDDETRMDETRVDPWLARHSEISAVVLPLRSRLHYEVVPVSGLTPAARRDFAAYFEAHPEGPDASYYRRALRAVRVMAEEDDPREEPSYALSPAYRRLVGWPRQALSTAAERELGEAGPRRLAHAHFELIRQAIAAHPGERIVVLFDAADGWYLVPRLRRLPGVHFIDALAFYDDLDR